jgi:hypothetical protein
MKVRWLFGAWGALAVGVLVLRFGVTGPRESLITLYAVGSLVLVGIAGGMLNHRFRRDLLAADRAVWEQLTGVPALGPGYHNNFRELAWITQRASAIPPHLRHVWQRARRLVWLPVAWFLTTPVICILVGVGGA